MFSLGFKWVTSDTDNKLRIIEYEIAGVFVLLVLGGVAFLIRRRFNKATKEIRTLQAIVPV